MTISDGLIKLLGDFNSQILLILLHYLLSGTYVFLGIKERQMKHVLRRADSWSTVEMADCFAVSESSDW